MQKVEWREVFNRQPVHFCLIDICQPMTTEILDILFETLENIFALSTSLKGSTRFCAFGLLILGNNVECIIQLQKINTNYEIMLQTLQEIRAKGCAIVNENACNKSRIVNAIYEALEQYQLYCQALSDDKKPQLELTIMSVQNGESVLRMLDSILNQIDLICFRKINVIEVLNNSGDGKDNLPDVFEQSKNENVDDNSQVSFQSLHSESNTNLTSSSVEATVKLTSIKPEKKQIEKLFKRWLHDIGTDCEHANIILGDKNDRPVVLKCDLRECLLNPELLPSSSQFFLSADTGYTQLVTPNRAKTVANKVPIFCLEAVALLKLYGICESVIFGNPLLLSATECWKIEWEELEANSQLFAALNKTLLAKEMALLVRRRPDIYVSGSKKSNPESAVYGYYIIMPSANQHGSMLIRSVITRELLLPGIPEIISNHESNAVQEESMLHVDQCLSKLETQEKFDPLMYSCNLYNCLLSSLLKMKPNTRNKY